MVGSPAIRLLTGDSSAHQRSACYRRLALSLAIRRPLVFRLMLPIPPSTPPRRTIQCRPPPKESSPMTARWRRGWREAGGFPASQDANS